MEYVCTYLCIYVCKHVKDMLRMLPDLRYSCSLDTAQYVWYTNSTICPNNSHQRHLYHVRTTTTTTDDIISILYKTDDDVRKRRLNPRLLSESIICHHHHHYYHRLRLQRDWRQQAPTDTESY